MSRPTSIILLVLGLCTALTSAAADRDKTAPPPDTTRGDAIIADYFRTETMKLADRCLDDVLRRPGDWEAKRGEYRRQLFEMLGLDPLPERTPLNPVITGRVEHEQFVVEKLHFQSRPQLYVTGNLYLPKNVKGKAPTILYVCGHGAVKKQGVSFGNKVSYQHHGGWFARNGYVCLVIDTLQLGEIEGIHHGTYRYGMWWWNARGYTPAGVEAWNCIRALDYLQSREEVDPERIGVTGRSGGGAYSWWIAALDDRIKAAVPVAGITTLKNHVIDGCVEGHCDCMFMVNTYQWDYPHVAALVAPRSLLISNTDKDRIFPLDGVVETYNKVRRLYELLGKLDAVGLQITEGPHKDTQELHIHAFRWFNRWLKSDTAMIEQTAVPFFQPEQLKVFDTLPPDQKNTEIHETFTAKAPEPSVPASPAEWDAMKQSWMRGLREKCFRAWPDTSEGPVEALSLQEAFRARQDGVEFSAFDFVSQGPIRLRLYLVQTDLSPTSPPATNRRAVVLHVLDADGWSDFLATMRTRFAEQLAGETPCDANADKWDRLTKSLQADRRILAYFAPRGIGPSAWNPDERKQVQIRRRFMLLGQTLDGVRVWDVRRAIQMLRTLPGLQDVPLHLQADGPMAGIALYASLFEPKVAQLNLVRLPASHRDGPIFLNVLRFLDMPQAVALAVERSTVCVQQNADNALGWDYPRSVARALGWDAQRFQVSTVPAPNSGESTKPESHADKKR